MARPTQGLILDLLRPLGTCRAQSVLQSSTKLVRSSVLINAPRFLSTSRTQYAIFNRSGDHAPSAPIAPDSPASTDAPLTPFQLQIAALETEALAKPTSLPDQLALLNALLEGGEVQGLVKYYETIALDESIEEGVGAEGSGRKTLVGSEEAWGLYVVALGRAGRLSEISKMVRKRDNILGNIKSIPTSAPLSTPATSAPSPFPQASATSATASTSTASPTSTASTAPISDSATAPRAPIVQSLLASRTQAGSAQTAAASETSTGIPGAGAGGATPGTPLSPIHVQLAPASPTSSFWRVARSIIVSLLWIFVFLTVFGMVGESTGLLKGGAKPAIFEPEEGKTVKFSDVHGVEEAKNELEEVVEFLRNPEKFSTLGGKLPKGVLLTGPPGTGKTMLARAVAGEAEVPFLFASGSSFDEMFVGVGAKRVRELFQVAREKAPAIIFIDELDAIGSKRSARDQHYMKQTLNQLLVELDGFAQTEGVIIIGATNFPESLDKALTRPGRFDKHVVVGLPDVRGRVEILKHHMGDVQYDVDVDPSVIARGCPGMSGADLQNLVNQAAVKAARDNAKSVQLKHFEWAKDRILMGAERKSHYVTEESKKATAYHEGGHALVALHTPGAMPLHKVTIMPRGQALGITFQLPEQDKDSYSRKEYNAMIDVALGGRAAEEMIFGRDDVTSGCSSDLQRATDVATRMIRSYGFSDKVGLVAHGDEESVYLSGRKKDEIEGEIRSFLDQSMQRAEKCLKDHEQELHTLASALVEYETLNLDEVKQVLAGKKLQRLASLGDSLKGTKEATAGPDGPIVEGI